MDPNSISNALRAQLSDLVADRIGLNFPPDRWPELERGLRGAAEELGFVDISKCAEIFLTAPLTKGQIQVLASHLTVGETYFFRERRSFDALIERVLPELIDRHRGREQRLRIWSAACCTGEEPYSLAILLAEHFPQLLQRHVSIIATDVNPRFLRKAVSGVFGGWSFRETPSGIKEKYFQRTKDGRYALEPEIKKRVIFSRLNLVDDVFPALATDTNAMDLILCRNVLMYFTPGQTKKVVGNLWHSLVENGWLVVSPTESSTSLFGSFATVNAPGAILYRKSAAKLLPTWSLATPAISEFISGAINPSAIKPPDADIRVAPPAMAEPVLEPWSSGVAAEPDSISAMARANLFFDQGQYADAADVLEAVLPESETDAVSHAAVLRLLTRARANQGNLGDALAWCDRWIAADKIDPAGHYLRAMILQEIGEPDQARTSLQGSVFLQPEFVLAHFSMGNLARNCGDRADARRHFANATNLLRNCDPEAPVPESDGLSAGRLLEMIASISNLEDPS